MGHRATPSFVFAQDEACSVSWNPDLMVSGDEPWSIARALWFVSALHEGPPDHGPGRGRYTFSRGMAVVRLATRMMIRDWTSDTSAEPSSLSRRKAS